MAWEKAVLKVGVGFAYDVPVPLPQLGHRSGYSVRHGNLAMTALIELRPSKTRYGGVNISGGISYHERDRFGLFAHSHVELRFEHSVEGLLNEGVFAVLASVGTPEQPGFALGPGDFGSYLCAEVFNYLVDLQTVAFHTHWVARITPDDIHECSLMDWTEPASPKLLGFLAGVPGDQRFVCGREPGFPSADPSRLTRVVSSMPLLLWEELVHSALHDLEVGRMRSAIMHSCLAFETYLRALIDLNPSPERDPNFSTRTLKELATKAGCIPSVIGFSLLAKGASHFVRETYARLAALRDSVMHHGDIAYEWPVRSGNVLTLETPMDISSHVMASLTLINEVARLAIARGKSSGFRGMTPSTADVLAAMAASQTAQGGAAPG